MLSSTPGGVCWAQGMTVPECVSEGRRRCLTYMQAGSAEVLQPVILSESFTIEKKKEKEKEKEKEKTRQRAHEGRDFGRVSCGGAWCDEVCVVGVCLSRRSHSNLTSVLRNPLTLHLSSLVRRCFRFPPNLIEF
jgi:hypothetical protein